MSQPAATQPPRERDRVVAVEAALDPVGGADAHRHRLLGRPHRAAGGEHLEREASRGRAPYSSSRTLVSGDRKRREQVAVRHVELEQVEAGRVGAPCRRHELVAHRVHVRARHLARHLADARQVRQRRRRDQRPVALRQRLVLALPQQLRRALAARVAELRADRRARVRVHEVDDPLPRGGVLVAVQAAAAGRDPPVRATCRSSRSSPGPAPPIARAPRWTRWKSPGVPSTERVHVHRRDHDAVGRAPGRAAGTA